MCPFESEEQQTLELDPFSYFVAGNPDDWDSTPCASWCLVKELASRTGSDGPGSAYVREIRAVACSLLANSHLRAEARCDMCGRR